MAESIRSRTRPPLPSAGGLRGDAIRDRRTAPDASGVFMVVSAMAFAWALLGNGPGAWLPLAQLGEPGGRGRLLDPLAQLHALHDVAAPVDGDEHVAPLHRVRLTPDAA